MGQQDLLAPCGWRTATRYRHRQRPQRARSDAGEGDRLEAGQNDLPGITLAWVTTLQVLPNGNIVIGNCHAGQENPQIIEMTREKKVVWTFHDWDALGDSVAASTIVPMQ